LEKSLPEDLREKPVEIYAKLEGYNPGGSVKDRPATRMILEAVQSGQLTKDRIILDATSGNTGIALAMIGTALGFKVELAMPSNVSEERKRIIQAYGAKIHYTDPLQSTDGAILFVRELIEKYPDRYCYIDQYNNDANWRSDSPFHGIEGLKYIETSIKEGVFVGQSSGAAFEAAIQIAREIKEGVIVFVCPDGGEKYLTTALWEF